MCEGEYYATDIIQPLKKHYSWPCLFKKNILVLKVFFERVDHN